MCPLVVRVFCKVLPRFNIQWTRVPREDLSSFVFSVSTPQSFYFLCACHFSSSRQSHLQKSFYSLIWDCAANAALVFEKNGLRFANNFVGIRACQSPQHFMQSIESVLDHLKKPANSLTSTRHLSTGDISVEFMVMRSPSSSSTSFSTLFFSVFRLTLETRKRVGRVTRSPIPKIASLRNAH